MRRPGPYLMLSLTIAVAGATVVWLWRGGGIDHAASASILSRQVTPDKALPQGFVVWSSNRAGNHEIFKMTLPDRKVTRLTRHPHTDYFARISPDGKSIVFSRSRKRQVSQRDQLPWDVILLDLESGRERVLARFGNTPTWSLDGRKVYFQRKVTQFVELDLKTGKERVIFQSGTGTVNKGTGLQTPHLGPDRKHIAVTLRYAQHMIGILDPAGNMSRVADGCQLTWERQGEFLYFIDHGGRMQNAVFVYQPDTNRSRVWFDAPGEFSYEYFPKLSNDERYLVFGASRGPREHEHDQADYEIFLWQVGTPPANVTRLTFNKSNDNWPDVYFYPR